MMRSHVQQWRLRITRQQRALLMEPGVGGSIAAIPVFEWRTLE
nr:MULTISPECIES: hypothetical protein [unclassified Ochrobactrum]